MFIEPGYYEDGNFGIRIEDVLLVKEAATRANFGGVKFHAFENITMCPIQARLIDTTLLSVEEIEFLNAYHHEIWTKVSPLLEKDPLARKWLERETQPIRK